MPDLMTLRERLAYVQAWLVDPNAKPLHPEHTANALLLQRELIENIAWLEAAQTVAPPEDPNG